MIKKILVVSHCILNTASKVEMDAAELAEEDRLRLELLRLCLTQGVQLLQMPCPEFNLYGSQRWGVVKNQLAHPHYINESKKMLAPIFMQLEEYLAYPADFEVMGIVSVEGSPSCGYKLTCAGTGWKGEIGCDPQRIAAIQGQLEMVAEPGVFMEVISTELQARHLTVPILTMDEAIQKLS